MFAENVLKVQKYCSITKLYSIFFFNSESEKYTQRRMLKIEPLLFGRLIEIMIFHDDITS